MLKMNFGVGGYDLDQTHRFMHPVAGAEAARHFVGRTQRCRWGRSPQWQYPSDRVNLTSYFAI
jgi:hypothetical protein